MRLSLALVALFALTTVAPLGEAVVTLPTSVTCRAGTTSYSCQFLCYYDDRLFVQAWGPTYTSAGATCGGAETSCVSQNGCAVSSPNPAARTAIGHCWSYSAFSTAVCSSAYALSRGPEGCTTATGQSCSVYCRGGDSFHVNGRGVTTRSTGGYGGGTYYEYHYVDAWGSCGGVSAACSGWGYCSATATAPVQYTDYGVCSAAGDPRSSGTCSASEGNY